MKKLLLTILLVPVLANAQLQNYLTGSTPKTHRELQGSPTATTRLDTIIHSITIVLDSTISSLQRYGLNTGNYSTIAAGLSDARSNRAPLIVPYDWTGGSPAPTTADSSVTIWDYRFGSFGFTGRRHWGFKSVWEADSLNRFRKILDSTKTHGRILLAEGTWTFDSLTISRPMIIEGTAIKRTKTTDTGWNGSVLKSTATTTAKNLLTVNESGVDLRNLVLEGNNRLNGHGLLTTRQAVSGSINTTLGGYYIDRVNSVNHGGDGIHLRGADGLIIKEPEAYKNAGFGIAIVSPNYDGVANAGNTAGGTTNIVLGGRTRANGLGGIKVGDQAATLLIGAEAIADTGYAAWFDDGRSRGGLLWADLELNVPKKEANPILTALRVDNYNGFFALNSYIGTTHSFGTYTADAGTNTTTIVDAALINLGPDDYLTGSDIINTSRSSARRRITDYVASTGTLTLASAVTGQTTGDTYQLKKYLNRAIHVDSLASGIFINNNIDHESDTSFAVTGYGYATFFNNINFDPADDAKAIGGAPFKWLNYNLSNIDSLSGGDARWTSNTEVHWISSDSLVFRTTDATKGISMDTPARIGIQPSANNHVFFFENAVDEETKELRIYGDADTTDGSLNKQYVRIAFSSATQNALTISNSVDSIKVGMGAPLLISGNNQTERHIEFLNHSGGTSLATPTNGLVRLYARGDTLYAKDDNGVERSLYAAAGASGDITAVNAGNGINGGGTTGDVTVRVDTTDTFRWLGNHFWIKDGDSLKFNLSTQLYPIDLEINNGRVWAVDSTGVVAWTDGIRQTFNPDGTNAGLNVGSQAGDPSSPSNGDLWYDATANELTARINGANVALGAGGGGGITVAQARQHTGWTSDATTSQDTLSRVYRLDKANIQFQVVDADNDSVLVIPQSLYPFNYKDATTQLAAYDSTGRFYSALGYDAVGAAALEFGSGDVPTITLTTDGTGNGEVVLPAQSVTGSEITNDSLTPTQVDEGQNFTWTANQRFNHSAYFNADADSFKVDLRTQLYPLDLEVGNARKWAVDSTGASTQAGSVTVVGSPGLLIGNGATSAGSIRISEDSDDGSNYTEITVPAMSANITYTLPPDDGDAGEQLQTNGSGVLTWEAAGSGSSSDMTTTFKIEEDWVSGAANTSGAMGKDWQRTIATSGTTTHQAGESGRPGIMRFFCANSAGSTAALHTDPSSILVNSAYVLTTSVRFSSLGTAGSNGAYYRVGFMDDVGATIPTDGAWIEFNVDSSATRWRAITGNGGTRTITTYTGSTVSTSTWYKLTITPNSGGTSIVFAVDGTTIATHTTNLPASGVGVAMVAAAVTASSTKYMEQDYVQVINTGLSR